MRFLPRSRAAFLRRALAPYVRPAVAVADVDVTFPRASASATGSAGGTEELPRSPRGASRPGLHGERARPPADPIAASVAQALHKIHGV